MQSRESFFSRLAWALKDTWVLAKRSLIRYKRLPQLLFFSTVQPIMFLLLFAFVFGGAIHTDATNYINYLLPGILIQSAMFGAIQTGSGLSDDMKHGLIDRFRSLPMAQFAVLAGRTLSDAMRNMFVVALMIGVGLIIGFRPAGGVFGTLAAFVIAIFFGFAFSWVSATIGLAVKNPETAQVAGFVWVFPLVYISSAYVPTATLPAVLKFLASISPVTVTIDAVRALTWGTPAGAYILGSTVWLVAIIAIFAPLATVLFRKTE